MKVVLVVKYFITRCIYANVKLIYFVFIKLTLLLCIRYSSKSCHKSKIHKCYFPGHIRKNNSLWKTCSKSWSRFLKFTSFTILIFTVVFRTPFPQLKMFLITGVNNQKLKWGSAMCLACQWARQNNGITERANTAQKCGETTAVIQTTGENLQGKYTVLIQSNIWTLRKTEESLRQTIYHPATCLK